jgi:hypothetical protein
MGALNFLDMLKITGGGIDLWDLLDRKRNGVQASTKKICRLMHLNREMTAFHLLIPSIRIKRKAAMSTYKRVKKQASKERITSLNASCKQEQREKNTTVVAQEKHLKNDFGQRTLAHRLKQLTGKQRGALLSSVNAPADGTKEAQKECSDKISMEQAFMEEGTRCFSQTNGTPLMDTDFINRVGYLGELPIPNKILEGTFITDTGMDQ